jgi:hypothetical protein
MSSIVGGAAAERAAGTSPSRARAAFAAVIVGAGTAVVTYRLLRSGS